MEEKKKQAEKPSATEKTSKGTYIPKAKKAKRAPRKKEHVVVLVKQSVVIVSLDGVNIKVARTGTLKDVGAGDKVML